VRDIVVYGTQRAVAPLTEVSPKAVERPSAALSDKWFQLKHKLIFLCAMHTAVGDTFLSI